MSSNEQIPVVEGLFAETAAGPRLLGSRCRSCNTPYFPRSPACHHPVCTRSEVDDTAFGPRGKLWSWAVQNYPPPPPARFDEPYVPYTVGVVDLEDGLRVVGRMSVDDAKSLRAGVEVELAIEPLCHDEQGREVMSWAFRPL
ncbi:MAG: DNA-binding protein [Deltaproteobacteria bacterium]|jgi:hypothetical protein|nr:DNA-binding protein [Deltaproteobacteria bacterium]